MTPQRYRQDQDRAVQPLTLRQLWGFLGLKSCSPEVPKLPLWPPDVFALCAAALKKSGAYTVILDAHRMRADLRLLTLEQIRAQTAREIADHAKAAQHTGDAWRQVIARLPDRIPSRLEKNWAPVPELWRKITDRVDDEVLSGVDHEVFSLLDLPEVCRALIELLAIADEACRGLGLPITTPFPSSNEDDTSSVEERENKREDQQYERKFLTMAEEELFPKQFGSTLCRLIHPSIARVLPKMHTAQCGLTVRAFSHHLAFCESDEVRPSWFSVPGSRGDAEDIYRMNILIAPWPMEVRPSQISESTQDHLPYRSFEVNVEDTGGEVASKIAALTTAAELRVGPIDAVIMPELAVTTHDYRLVRAALLQKGILSIVGVSARHRSSNYMAIDVPISRHFALHLRQRKHHRWKLDESQIDQYHLGSRLRTDKRYWEHIDVRERQLRFIALRPWLVATALLCEDLARHDPVGDLIKGVGPNLVIALLMDGPQITKRWSSRYAAALADDPGCSVLSITSLGMAELSRPRSDDGKSSRVVGLWKDAFSGIATQLEVKPGDHGVVITLMMRNRVEKTADFRSDGGIASYPTLAGFHSIRLPQDIKQSQIAAPQWLSIAEASTLARLAQQPSSSTGLTDGMMADFMPLGLESLQGSAFRIGREIWRRKTGGKKPSCDLEEPWASQEEEETAEKIISWDRTNREFHHS